MSNCDIIDLFKNITNNCENDIEIIKDNCNIICLITITKALNICYIELLNTGLLDQFKSIIKWCMYKKYEIINTH